MSITVHILLSAMRAVKKTGLIKGSDTDVDENLRKAREYNRRYPRSGIHPSYDAGNRRGPV